MAAQQFASVSYVDDDPRVAARAAAIELRRQLGGPPDWVVAFFAFDFPPEAVVEGLYSVWPPQVQLVGCSSYAEIDSTEALTHSVTLLGARAPALRFFSTALTPQGRSSFALGQALGDQLKALEELQRATTREADAERQAKLALLREKEAAIAALSTPIIAVQEGVLVLPRIGALDDQRAETLTANLLDQIQSTRPATRSSI